MYYDILHNLTGIKVKIDVWLGFDLRLNSIVEYDVYGPLHCSWHCFCYTSLRLVQDGFVFCFDCKALLRLTNLELNQKNYTTLGPVNNLLIYFKRKQPVTKKCFNRTRDEHNHAIETEHHFIRTREDIVVIFLSVFWIK